MHFKKQVAVRSLLVLDDAMPSLVVSAVGNTQGWDSTDSRNTL